MESVFGCEIHFYSIKKKIHIEIGHDKCFSSMIDYFFSSFIIR